MKNDRKNDALFYICSLLEFIARSTNNKKDFVLDKIGLNNIKNIYNLSDVFHSMDIKDTSKDLIMKYNITKGNYNINSSNFRIPSCFEIGRIYECLISRLSKNEEEYINKLNEVMHSWIVEKLDNYNSSFYYESPEYIYQCYIDKKIY